jgi:hypothetical protein
VEDKEIKRSIQKLMEEYANPIGKSTISYNQFEKD